MHDLNDFRLFAYIVEEQGLSAAGRKLGLPRSHISRRLAELEADLGVRLIHRSTRSFSVTDIGQEFYLHCRAMLSEAEAAADVISRQKSEPQGVIRIACPSSLIQYQAARIVSDFMRLYPKVTIILESTNRRVDVLREGFDLAIRVRFPPLEDSDLIVRRFANDDQHLVCAPSCLEQGPARNLEELAALPSLSWNPDQTSHFWDLVSPDGPTHRVHHTPRLLTQDMSALLDAAVAGIGVVQLPGVVARPRLKTAELVEVLPGWRPLSGMIHAVFPTRRGMLPAVRAFLDFCDTRFS
ncbi:LysR substrate-binding domain-containing protein [Brevundimonas sp.]|uniref:LysR substrate-binding domain-containing protein n=1 Tax=Brevundimonas sp. TaxID=1871086 RepID=UPI002FC5A47B